MRPEITVEDEIVCIDDRALHSVANTFRSGNKMTTATRFVVILVLRDYDDYQTADPSRVWAHPRERIAYVIAEKGGEVPFPYAWNASRFKKVADGRISHNLDYEMANSCKL